MIRNVSGVDVFVTVISHARAKNVERMSALVGEATWVVGYGEADIYEAAGAKYTITGGKLCESRNLALRKAWEKGIACVQLSDDLTKLEAAIISPDGKTRATPISFEETLTRMLQGLTETKTYLAGVAPTNNPFYSNPRAPINTSGFIVGDCIVVRPCGLYFDTQFSLKEDYDYTLQHLSTYGAVARRDDLLLSFLHRTNAGGAVAVRTSELEKENIRRLKTKWPSRVRDNPKRPNEVLLSRAR